MQKRLLILGIILLCGFFLVNPYLVSAPDVQELNLPPAAELNGWLNQHESIYPQLLPQHRKQIAFTKERFSEYALVYIHGFSSTRLEISPVMEKLSLQLNANLFTTRLHGHGLGFEPFGQTNSEDYFFDAEEAYQIAKKIGKKVILVGTSTGATLVAHLAATHPDVYKVVLISPNFGLPQFGSFYLGGPLGPLFARLVAGSERQWKPENEEQAKNWTTRYPTRALVGMMNVVNYVKLHDLDEIKAPTLILLTKKDSVVSLDAAEKYSAQIKNNKTVWIKSHNHILAGDIVSPESTLEVIAVIEKFIRCDKECD